MTQKNPWANKIWCPCGNEWFISKVQIHTKEEAIIFSQGFNEGLQNTYDKIMELMYDWHLDFETRETIKANLRDLVHSKMPVVIESCGCNGDGVSNG